MVKDTMNEEHAPLLTFSSGKQQRLFKYYKNMGGIFKLGQEEQQWSLFDENIDGGYGWIITAGAFLCHFQATGVMQDYYEQHVFHNTHNVAVKLSFVGTLLVLVTYSFMILSTFLESLLGLKVCLIIGSCFISTGMFLAGSATEIWHLYLWIGLCCGCGCSIFTSIAMKIVPEWFDRKLNTAMGISVSSAALGGFAFPFVMTYFNDLLGATWALRCLSISFIAINIIVCSVIRKRRSHTQRKRIALDEIIRLGLLRDVNVIIWCCVGFFQVLSNYVPFTFLPSYATYIGLSPFQGSAVISIASLISVVGRIYAGYLADSIGNINTCFIFMFTSGIASICVWTLARNYFTLLVFASLFGFFGGVYNALQGPIAVKLFGLENYSAGYTLIMLLNCPAIFGPTIASAIEARTDGEPFLTYKLFYGVTSVISAMIVLVLKFRIGRKLTAKV